jgi:F420-dependent oxidoreductase-like protein
MRLALHLPNFTVPGQPASIATTVADTARAADETGFHTLTVMDHWFQMESMGDPAQPMLEAYTTLGYLAAVTERIRLGTLVTGVTYRYPGLLAKTVATLDVLSQGRAFLGIGAAWYEQEHLGLGVPFPPLKERFERLEEALQIARLMWEPGDAPYEGTHYQLARTLCDPAPLQEHLPILIGGSGEQKTLRMVAQYADECNLFGGDLETIRHKIAVLHEHCERLGRDPGEIEVTMLLRGSDPVTETEAFLAEAQQYGELGVRTIWLVAPGDDPAGWTRATGEAVVSRLAEL